MNKITIKRGAGALLAMIAVIAMVAVMVGAPGESRGQDSGSFTMTSNNVPANYTNSSPSATVITVPSIYSRVHLWASAANGSTTNAANGLLINYALSPDGVTWTATRSTLQSRIYPGVTNAFYHTLPPDGVNTVVNRLVIDTQGGKYVKILNIECPTASATNFWTNIVVSWCASP